VLGRFVSKDPIGLLGGLHAYAYAPNPIGWVDPLGLQKKKTAVTYTRGAGGRIERVQATIDRTNLDAGTGTNPSSRSRAKQMAKCDKVHAGHALAKRLGGSGGVNDVFPQTPNINIGAYRAYEGEVAKAVKKNGSATVDIQFFYPNKTSQMPSSIEYSYTSGDKTESQGFDNPNPCKGK